MSVSHSANAELARDILFTVLNIFQRDVQLSVGNIYLHHANIQQIPSHFYLGVVYRNNGVLIFPYWLIFQSIFVAQLYSI